MAGLGGLALSLQFVDRSRPPAHELTPRTQNGGELTTVEGSRPPTAPKTEVHSQVLKRPAADSEPRAATEHRPAPESAVDASEHPPPITPAHRRIFEENNRVGALNGAMDRGDFVALRRMNAAYRRDYPEDAHALLEGYDLIADCLEQRTTVAVDAARRFWQTHRASSLRRHVRRHCLEERPGP